MAAYRRVYDSHHLQADCQEPGSAPKPYTLGSRVWASFTFSWLGNSGRCCIGFSLLEINHAVVTRRVIAALAGVVSSLQQMKYKGAEILLNKLTAAAAATIH